MDGVGDLPGPTNRGFLCDFEGHVPAEMAVGSNEEALV